MPGMAMSRIRHLVPPTLSEARNASADENAWAAKPNSLSKSGNDSRTDSSSSITDTSARLEVTASSATCRTSRSGFVPFLGLHPYRNHASPEMPTGIVLWYWLPLAFETGKHLRSAVHNGLASHGTPLNWTSGIARLSTDAATRNRERESGSRAFVCCCP